MKAKFKSVFTGLFYILATAGFIALAVYNYVLTVDMKGYLAVLTFVVGTISMAAGVMLAYIDGNALIDRVFYKDKKDVKVIGKNYLKEDKDHGKKQ